MALIMYLTRVPRYKNTTAKDIQLIESYFAWQNAKEMKSKYSCDTFEEWCGISDSELPDAHIIEYYKQFYTMKQMYVEGIGEEKTYSIFEQLARFVKTNQIFRWFIDNVIEDDVDSEKYYEVSKEQLEKLLIACKKIMMSLTKINRNEYTVNEDIAKQVLPLLEERGYFFGPDTYDETYISQINETISVINNILMTTNFENQIVYFNVIW